MNERFKFRCWNKKKKTMHYEAEETYNGIFGKPKIEHTSFSGLLNDKNYIVMQSIGIKDKNGKLVYEGDILQHENLHEYLLVRFNPEYNILNLQNTGNRYLFTRLTDKDTVFEIIGNVYENKKLVKKLGWKQLIGEE